jgi:hypothetical protein
MIRRAIRWNLFALAAQVVGFIDKFTSDVGSCLNAHLKRERG